jgi:general secretion pathway protein D
VNTVHDKVPVLGDLPLIGKAFRSRGQSSQKRNLLIFVTANLVSPGGSPKKQAGPGVRPSSLYQNPTIVTPGRAESRARAAP